jgi:hypothetical protein
MFLHNVGEAPAIQIEIDAIGRDPKWMKFGRIAVVRPGSDPVRVPISYVDAADVFEVGAYLSMIAGLRGESNKPDDASADDGHPICIRYEDRHGAKQVDGSYELRFHSSDPFIAANAYYEVERRSPTLQRLTNAAQNPRAATQLSRPRIRLSRSERRVDRPADAKTTIKGLHVPLFDVRNTGREEAFDITITLHPTNAVTVKSRRIDHLSVGGEKTILHGDLRYEQNGVASATLNLWMYIVTANIGGPTITLPLRAHVTYRDGQNRHYTTTYDVSNDGSTFIGDDDGHPLNIGV